MEEEAREAIQPALNINVSREELSRLAAAPQPGGGAGITLMVLLFIGHETRLTGDGHPGAGRPQPRGGQFPITHALNIFDSSSLSALGERVSYAVPRRRWRTKLQRFDMKIGPYQLKNSLVMAPMAGVTDPPFRQLCKRQGAGMKRRWRGHLVFMGS